MEMVADLLDISLNTTVWPDTSNNGGTFQYSDRVLFNAVNEVLSIHTVNETKMNETKLAQTCHPLQCSTPKISQIGMFHTY